MRERATKTYYFDIKAENTYKEVITFLIANFYS